MLLLRFLFLGFAFALWGRFFFTVIAISDVVRQEVTVAVPTADLGIGGDNFILH